MARAIETLIKQLEEENKALHAIHNKIAYNQVQIAHAPKRWDDQRIKWERENSELFLKHDLRVRERISEINMKKAAYEFELDLLEKKNELKRMEQNPQDTPSVTNLDPKQREFLDSLNS